MALNLDPVLNFADVEVSTLYDDVATSVILSVGEGAKLPDPVTDGYFNLVWWNWSDYPNPAWDPNKEIVRCTARATNTLTILRAQEGTSATTKNEAGKTYRMALAFTKKSYDDIDNHLHDDRYYTESEIDSLLANSSEWDDAYTHISNTSNPHSVTKLQVGLSAVENTALSTWGGTANIITVGDIIANRTALTSGLASTDELLVSDAGAIKKMSVSVLESYLETAIQDVFYTESEIDAFGFIDSSFAHFSNTSNPHSVTKSQVGLGSVENTALSTWSGSSNITTVGNIISGRTELTSGLVSTDELLVNDGGIIKRMDVSVLEDYFDSVYSLSGHTHDTRYYTETEIDSLLGNYYTQTNLQTSGQASVHWDNITNEPTFLTGNQTITLSGDATGSGTTSITVTVVNDSHTHDGRYYTESEVDSLLTGYSTTSHNHSLDSLSNVTITTIASGELLKWSGTAWINNTLAEAGISAVGHNHSGTYIEGITAGTLIDISGTANITVNVDLSELSTSVTNSDGAYFVVVDGTTGQYKLTKANINLSGFNNDSGWTTNVGTITGVTAGVGLSGGGSSGSVSLALDFSELTDMTGDISGTTEFILQNGTIESRKAASEIKLSFFNNDAGWTTNTGTLTGITAGALIDVSGTTNITVAVDLSELTDMTETAVGTDELVILDASVQKRKALNEIPLSAFNNDSGFITSETDSQTLSWNGTNGELSISGGNTVDLDGRYLTSETSHADVLVDGDIGVTVQAYSTILANTTASFLTAHQTKLGYITVTQAVNLDTMESNIATNNAKVTMTYPSAGIALSTGSAWGTSITNNSTNWNTAYGWGNHASAGYYSSGSSPTFGTVTVTSLLKTDELRCNSGNQLVINVGESHGEATGQTSEVLYVNAENGLEINSSPDNWATGWATRNTVIICNSSGNSAFNNIIFNADSTYDIGTNSVRPANVYSDTFIGNLTGNVTGNATTATTANEVNVYSTGDSGTYRVALAGALTGNQSVSSDSSLYFDASTNTLTSSIFSGALSGNASTATTLQTARTIAGVSFNGSANISIPYANLTSIPSTFAPSAHTLDSHSNVTITSNSAGEILKWSGSAWINNTLAEAGIASSSHAHTFASLTSVPTTLSGYGITDAVSSTTLASWSGTSNITTVGDIIVGRTELTSGLVSTDELLVSDAGVIKRMDVSVLQSYMQSNLSFQSVGSYITASGVTYENLNTNSDVGNGAAQVAIGNHQHKFEFSHSYTVPDAENGNLIGFAVPVMSGTTVKITRVRYWTSAGTCTLAINKNGTGLTGFTSMSASTTAATTDASDQTLSDLDVINCTVSSASSLGDLTVSIIFEITVAVY